MAAVRSRALQSRADVEVRTAGNTIARLIQTIQERRIVPTHFLIVQVTYHADLQNMHRQRVRQALFNNIHNRRTEVNLGQGENDVVHVTWMSVNQGSSMMYYTTSRFEQTYVRQLTGRLMRGVYAKILRDADLSPGNFQISFITAKNLDFIVDVEQAGAQAAIAQVPEDPIDRLVASNRINGLVAVEEAADEDTAK